MQIQVNTDGQTKGSAELTRLIEDVVEGALERFSERITRVEVHLTDENSSQKGGDDDKRCQIEARLAGLQPISVSHRGASVELALDGAADKLEKSLERMLGRLDGAKGGTSASGDPVI